MDLFKLLRSCKLFSSLSDSSLTNLLDKSKKIYLNKDKILFTQGDLSYHLYIVLSGKIAIFLNSDTKQVKVINEILPGQPVGELTALTHEPRPSTAKATKRSILLKIPSDTFIELCEKHPNISLEVINTTFKQSRNIIKLLSDESIRKHIAIIPANQKMDLKLMHENLEKYLSSYPDVILLSDLDDKTSKYRKNINELKKFVDDIDNENKTIVYLIKSYKSTLSEICFGQERVDMIYVVGNGESKPNISRSTHYKIKINSYKIKPELILLYANEKKRPQYTSKWLKQISYNMHHNIRINCKTDWERLLRFINGKAVCVVFGGGGLRCWAQLGALMALSKMKIPIDAVGGTSAGAIVAGYYAMTESYKELQGLEELSETAREAISLKNLTWPSAALFNGKDFTTKLQEIFRKINMEDLWIPCFCITTNLSNNKSIIYRKGFLWKHIRSSTAVPLVFPPVVANGKLHIDGGLINNLPVDVMKKMINGKGIIIAIELTHMIEDITKYKFPPILPFMPAALAKLKLAHKNYKFPPLIDTFLKSLLTGSATRQEENAAMATILVSPNLSKFSLLRIKKKDESTLIKIGYKETLKKIKAFQRKNNSKE